MDIKRPESFFPEVLAVVSKGESHCESKFFCEDKYWLPLPALCLDYFSANTVCVEFS